MLQRIHEEAKEFNYIEFIASIFNRKPKTKNLYRFFFESIYLHKQVFPVWRNTGKPGRRTELDVKPGSERCHTNSIKVADDKQIRQELPFQILKINTKDLMFMTS